MRFDEKILEKYKILAYLASGSFSSVFRAHDETTDRIVAIKALHKEIYMENGEQKNRMHYYLSEIKAMSKIAGHPNIVTIYTVEPGIDKYLALIVMEYVEGPSLHELIQKGKLNAIETINIGLDICNGLKATHSQNIMHRDLKPQNILLTAEKHAKIADFSIARVFSDKTDFASTLTGTRRYMAPEQHYHPYDYRADLYATALVLYQTVTGHFPFSGESPDELDKNKAASKIEHLDKCPEILRSFFQRALHRELEKRYETADKMYEELDQIRQDEYFTEAKKLLGKTVNLKQSGLAPALERYRKTFRLSKDAAERLNQDLFMEYQREEREKHSAKLLTQIDQHYSAALLSVQRAEYPRVITELHEAQRLYIDEPTLIEKVDTVFKQLSQVEGLNTSAPTVESIVELIRKLPRNEEAVLRAFLVRDADYDEQDSQSDPGTRPILGAPPPAPIVKPIVKAANSYRLLIEEASPEFLLDQVHNDIQHPHEREALRIHQQAQIYLQQENKRLCLSHYKKLGAFYQKQAINFIKENELELIANCYMRARLAYAAGNKKRPARRNARNGGIYYARLARQLEMQRAWTEAGKAYVLSADNYAYANLSTEVEESRSTATICYFNAAESAHLHSDFQTAYDFYMLILTIGEKLPAPTKAMIEAEKLLSEIQVQDEKLT